MFLVLLLLLRQRTAEAVAGSAALVAATAIWVAVQGREPALVLTFSLGHVVAFVFWLLLPSRSGAATTAIEEALEAEDEARLAGEEQLTLNAVMAAGLADYGQGASLRAPRAPQGTAMWPGAVPASSSTTTPFEFTAIVGPSVAAATTAVPA